MSNPFHLPGTGRPGGPLDPYRRPDHEHLYLPVGGSNIAFEHFVHQIGTGEDLIADGRFVVVTGSEGCGKTSLINRCAAWLRRRSDDSRTRCVVLSLTDVARPSESMATRTQIVIRATLDELEDRDLVSREERRHLLERSDEPDLFYRQLRKVLHDVILLVLLPPSDDLVVELEQYAKLTRGPIVFFAESAYTESVRHQWQRIAAAARGPEPILCEVGPLAGDDAWAFVRSRLGEHPEGLFPTLSEETVRLVVQARRFSVGELQNLLYTLYAEINQQQRSALAPAAPELTYNDITDFYFRRAVT